MGRHPVFRGRLHNIRGQETVDDAAPACYRRGRTRTLLLYVTHLCPCPCRASCLKRSGWSPRTTIPQEFLRRCGAPHTPGKPHPPKQHQSRISFGIDSTCPGWLTLARKLRVRITLPSTGLSSRTATHTHSPSGDTSQWPGFRCTVDSQTLSMRPVATSRTSMKGFLFSPYQPKYANRAPSGDQTGAPARPCAHPVSPW